MIIADAWHHRDALFFRAVLLQLSPEKGGSLFTLEDETPKKRGKKATIEGGDRASVSGQAHGEGCYSDVG